MTSVLTELPLSYAVLSEGRRCGSAPTVREPSPAPGSSTPRVHLHLKPGQKGTKPVELLVAERGWQPPQPRFAHDQIVGLRVAFADVAVRDRVKQAGGTWNPERRVWELRDDRAGALGLTGRIVDELASTSGCQGSSGEHLHADARATSR